MGFEIITTLEESKLQDNILNLVAKAAKFRNWLEQIKLCLGYSIPARTIELSPIYTDRYIAIPGPLLGKLRQLNGVMEVTLEYHDSPILLFDNLPKYYIIVKISLEECQPKKTIRQRLRLE